MSRKAGNAAVFILGIVLIPCSRADVLNYAREWNARDSENKTVSQPPAPAQESKPSAPRPKSNVQKTTPVKEKPKTKKPAAIKEKAAPAIATDNRAVKMPDIRTPVIKKEQPVVSRDVGSKKEMTLPDTRILGGWVKSLIHHITLSPSDVEIRHRYQEQHDELQRVKAKLSVSESEIQRLNIKEQEFHSVIVHAKKMEEKNAQWQVLTQKLQQNLKEAQYPSLPSTDDGLVDFAAGMAMGFDVLEVLKQRDEQGIPIDKTLFLAGISETVRGERRLPQEQFEHHLARANQRVEDAMQKMLKEKEVRDRKWLENFVNDEGTLAAGKAAWYKIIHTGEQLFQDDSSAGELTISVNRRLSDGTLIADSDLSGLILQEKFIDLPDWLQVVVNAVRLHGEAEIAVKVNEYGDPWEQGTHVEHWRIRVIEQQTL
ncbi:FKBP-type peptidylprolyl isomerase [Raoultella terrigena]|uniref:FKBP-type peptidyl-prolyl cis-trans isomerase N-terminal domain-containing protein n=1 Tax=Raoultella terrigena TaxID=577 RepID=UPI002DB6438C|nr:FKBP-type peptidyl-prolyl cis-trans isomerase N-terminal domain-containing protein [Raoultella terrigena]MEB8194993.1 FKBP-type peptidylprolyl isomerase [Raoultella terrigena]